MKKGRPLLVAAIVAVVGLLGWLATQFLASDAPKLGKDAPAAKASSAADLAAPATATTEAAPTAERKVETIAPVIPTVAAGAPLPESYRKALSGIRGRLVEEDGKPVAGLQVELLEVLGSGLQSDFERAFATAAAGLPVMPPIAIADGRSDEKGVFELHGAQLAGFHGLGVDLGGPRGTLRFVDRTLASGEVSDLGDITLSPYVTWTGTVVDEDGNPVPDARVRATLLPPIAFQPGVADAGRVAAIMEVRNWGNTPAEIADIPASMRAWESKLPFPTARTKADGTFSLPGVPQGLATLVVDRDGFTGSFKGPSATAKRDRDVGTITLSRGRTITGRVVDAAGAPIAGAQVIGGVVIEAIRLVIAMPATAPTGADGGFAIEHLSEQGGDLRVAARSASADAWTLAQVEDESRPVTITLPVGRELEVTLVDASGGVVPEAELSLRPRRGPPFLTMAPPQPIASDRIEKLAPGRLRVRGVKAGMYQLIGRAPGLALAWTDLEVRNVDGDAPPSRSTLLFTPAGTLAVRVVDRDTQAPIEHAEVTLSGEERMSPPIVARRSDATGVATLTGVPLQTMQLRVAHPAYAPRIQAIAITAASAEAPLDVVLGPGASVHGRVHQAGKALLEPMLFMLHNRGDGRSLDDDVPRFAVPGLDGTFTLKGLQPVRSRWELMPRMFAGDPQQAMQDIAAARAGGFERRGNVELAEGKTTELDIDIDPAAAGKPARITGVVRMPSGGATFVVRLDCSSPNEGAQRIQKTATARANQRFTIEDVPAGWINLSIERQLEVAAEDGTRKDFRNPPLHQEWFEIDAGVEHEVDVTFDPVVQEVRVLDGAGQPAAGQGVELTWIQDMGNGGSFSQSVWGSTGPDGVARIEVPRPGRYSVKSQHPEHGRASLEAEVPSRDAITLELEIGVPFAGRIVIDPDPGTKHIWFSVVAMDDRKQFDTLGWVELTEGKRDFKLLGLAPGSYRAQIYVDDGKNAQAEFELGHNGDDRIVLRFKLD